ncbi:hypothetical protein TNCV_3846871 [Trichonephila clavipes]|nr:hypothetical protein TNCV_3846871 [Trichonephila clavipes]
MLQDYDTSFSAVSTFHDPGFSSLSLLSCSDLFLLRRCQILFSISSLVRPVARPLSHDACPVLLRSIEFLTSKSYWPVNSFGILLYQTATNPHNLMHHNAPGKHTSKPMLTRHNTPVRNETISHHDSFIHLSGYLILSTHVPTSFQHEVIFL